MSNIFESRVSQILTPAEEATVVSSLETVETTLPWLIGLTTQERMSIPKIDSINRDFVADAIDIIIHNTNLFPAYFNVLELEKDFTLYNNLAQVLPIAERVHEKLQDTQMKAGSEAYITALAAYRLLQAAAKAGVPGTDVLVARLKARFENQGNQGGGNEEEETPTPPVA